MAKSLLCNVLVCLLAGAASADDPLAELAANLPTGPSQCDAARTQAISAATRAIEQWAADLTWSGRSADPERILHTLRRLVETKGRVDAHLAQFLSTRTQFADLPAGSVRREELRQYLQTASRLIDLSGRFRYLLRDAIEQASLDLDPHPDKFEALIDLLTEHRVSIGAAVMAYVLFDPPPDSGAKPFPRKVKHKALRLLAETSSADLLPDLAAFAGQPGQDAESVVTAVEIIRRIGLPQRPRPGGEPNSIEAALTAEELLPIVSQLKVARDDAQLYDRRRQLLLWLDERAKKGVPQDSFRVNGFDIRPGDWLLMRNPSPYNLFTDLSPGLFTHVGVVATEQGSDGVCRFVIVDLPERGDHIPATNADAYLDRTVHYFFLRHKDPAVGHTMGRVAASLIGNESQFDLTFRTARVPALKGKLGKDTIINTYCAGFLLVCAQETAAPREQFFPLRESVAGGNCSANLAKIGLSIGDDFVSPTGALFSPYLEIVGRREPMYTPDREIKESIYDHFAQAMIDKRLTPAPGAYQALREELAGLAKHNRWLARALARANNVSEHLDLESAAKAAAVIETLDEIADTSMAEFLGAREALLAAPTDPLAQAGRGQDELEQVARYRQRHQLLLQGWLARRISPRQLRIELVDYYVARGREQVDLRFFREAE